MTIRRALAIGIPLLLVASLAQAGPFDSRPKVLLHVAPVTTKNGCTLTMTDCAAANVAGGQSNYFVYLLAAPGNLLTTWQFDCGISYGGDNLGAMNDGAGIEMFSWVLCASLQFPDAGWTTAGARPRSANSIVWDQDVSCQTGGTAVAGYFYVGVYSADTLWVTRNPYNQRAHLVNCQGDVEELAGSDLGSVIFSANGNVPGCNPCTGPCVEHVVEPPSPPPPLPQPTPKILLHVAGVSSQHVCTPDNLLSCSSAVTSGGLSVPNAGPWHYVYLLATLVPPPVPSQTADVGGIQCGLTYDGNNPAGDLDGHGIDIFDWHLCATLQFPSGNPAWPKPGSGNLITWETSRCQDPPRPAIAGYFYLGAYDPGVLRIIPRPVDGLAKVAKCSGFELVASEGDLGSAVFSASGTVPGCNPCVMTCTAPVPVRPATWSGIKTLYH